MYVKIRIRLILVVRGSIGANLRRLVRCYLSAPQFFQVVNLGILRWRFRPQTLPPLADGRPAVAALVRPLPVNRRPRVHDFYWERGGLNGLVGT